MSSLLDTLTVILALGSLVAIVATFALAIILLRERRQMRFRQNGILQPQGMPGHDYSPEVLADLVKRLRDETLRRQNEVVRDSFGEILIALSSTYPEYESIEKPKIVELPASTHYSSAKVARIQPMVHYGN